MLPKVIRINLRRPAHAQACRTSQPLVKIYAHDGDRVYKAAVGLFLSPDGRVCLDTYTSRARQLPAIREPKPKKGSK